MWRIESDLKDTGAHYDHRAAIYDRLVRSRTYNRIAWSTTPSEYTALAAAAFESRPGLLLEVAAGSAAATAELHAQATRPSVLVDLSRPMLERAARRIAADSASGAFPARIRLVQADLLGLPFPPYGFSTVLGLGLTHLFDDIPTLVTALRTQLAPGGELHLSGLVGSTRRGRRYLGILHRAGEVAEPHPPMSCWRLSDHHASSFTPQDAWRTPLSAEPESRRLRNVRRAQARPRHFSHPFDSKSLWHRSCWWLVQPSPPTT